MADEEKRNCEAQVAARKSLPELARQWSKAIERGKGMRLSAADLELLTSAGVNDLLQSAAAANLKEKVTWRETRELNGCTNAETTGLAGIAAKTDRSVPLISPFSGTPESIDGSALLAHAQLMLGRPGRR